MSSPHAHLLSRSESDWMPHDTDPLLGVTVPHPDLQTSRSRNNTIIFTLMLVLVLSVSPGLCVVISNQSKETYTNWVINNIVPLILLGLCVFWWIYSMVVDCCFHRHLNGCLNDHGVTCGGWFLREFPQVIAAVANYYLEKQLKQAQEEREATASTYIRDLRAAAQHQETNESNEATAANAPEPAVTTINIGPDKRIRSDVDAIAKKFQVKPEFIQTRLNIVQRGLPSIKQESFELPVYDPHSDKFRGTIQFKF